MPRGISVKNHEALRVTNRLLKQKVKYLTRRLKLLEGRLYRQNRGSIRYTRRESDKEPLAKQDRKIYKD